MVGLAVATSRGMITTGLAFPLPGVKGVMSPCREGKTKAVVPERGFLPSSLPQFGEHAFFQKFAVLSIRGLAFILGCF